MGGVFAATHLAMERPVALKVMLPTHTSDPIHLRRFEREARLASQLSHPNTLRLFDFGRTSSDELYIVSEILHGQSLRELLRSNGPLGVSRALRLTIQTLKGLSEAHHLKLVHRDVKPDNLFLTEMHGEGEHIKVLDFGLARPVGGAAQKITVSGVAVGTPAYMAPEQILGQEVDARIDIYAMGAVLFELLMGGPAIEGKSVVELLYKQVNAPTPELPLPEGNPRGWPQVAAIIARAMHKSREARFQSADEMRAACEEALAAFADAPRDLTLEAAIHDALFRPAKETAKPKPTSSTRGEPPVRPPETSTARAWIAPAVIAGLIVVALGIWLGLQ